MCCIIYATRIHGQGTGPLLLSYVTCTGTESSLLSCSRTGTYLHRCSHIYDAGVVCPPCKYCSYLIFFIFMILLEFCVYMLVKYIPHQYLCLQYNARLLYCHNIDILTLLFATHIQLRVWPMRLLDSFTRKLYIYFMYRHLILSLTTSST